MNANNGEMIAMETRLLLNRPGDDYISDDLRHLLHAIGTMKRTRKDSYLFHEGMDAKEIFLVKSGLIQISKLASDGRELNLRLCKSNTIIGELNLFSDHPTYFLSAKVIESGEVLAIDKEKLEQEISKNAPLAMEMMKWSTNHMRKFQSKIRDLLLNGKKGALYSTLIRLSNSYGIKHSEGIIIDLPLTNQELAKFCSCTRESVNRMLVELRKQNVLEIYPNKRILIKDIQFLRNENICENCPIDICNIN